MCVCVSHRRYIKMDDRCSRSEAWWLAAVLFITPASYMLVDDTWTKLKSQTICEGWQLGVRAPPLVGGIGELPAFTRTGGGLFVRCLVDGDCCVCAVKGDWEKDVLFTPLKSNKVSCIFSWVAVSRPRFLWPHGWVKIQGSPLPCLSPSAESAIHGRCKVGLHIEQGNI